MERLVTETWNEPCEREITRTKKNPKQNHEECEKNQEQDMKYSEHHF